MWQYRSHSSTSEAGYQRSTSTHSRLTSNSHPLKGSIRYCKPSVVSHSFPLTWAPKMYELTNRLCPSTWNISPLYYYTPRPGRLGAICYLLLSVRREWLSPGDGTYSNLVALVE
jgi:hypothetical protein